MLEKNDVLKDELAASFCLLLSRSSRLMSVCSNFHLLPSHQEEVDSGNVYADVVTEILQDIPDGGPRPQRDGGARTIWEHHAALSW